MGRLSHQESLSFESVFGLQEKIEGASGNFASHVLKANNSLSSKCIRLKERTYSKAVNDHVRHTSIKIKVCPANEEAW